MLKVSLTKKEKNRILSKISIDLKTNCWNWTGSCNSGGYGHTTFKSKCESVHRLIYAWLVKPIPRNKGRNIPQLDHLCKNIKCCNPKHLELVSFKENILRGDSPSAKHARQTHCKNGHKLPDKPNYFRKNGRSAERICLICRKEHENSSERKAAQRKNKEKRMNGPKGKILLEKQREYSRQYYHKHKHS